MAGELVQATLPLAMSAAALLAGGELRERRRRVELNRALHEVRRPLQALALSAEADRVGPVLDALGELDGVINRSPPSGRRTTVELGSIALAAVSRWRTLADSARIALHRPHPAALVDGDPIALERAIDNLIANALEHGRPPVDVFVTVSRSRVRLRVRDRGQGGLAAGRGGRGETLPDLRRRLRDARPGSTGDSDARRGHGLEVVRAVAVSHGGRFVIRPAPSGTIAVLDLPRVAPPSAAAA